VDVHFLLQLLVRCPRNCRLPILCTVWRLRGHRLVWRRKANPRVRLPGCSGIIWARTGRVNELKFSLAMYFSRTASWQGIKNLLAIRGLAWMMKARRLNPMEILGGPKMQGQGWHSQDDCKAREIEERKQGYASWWGEREMPI